MISIASLWTSQRHTQDVLETCKINAACVTADTFVSSRNIEAPIAESDSALKSDTETRYGVV